MRHHNSSTKHLGIESTHLWNCNKGKNTIFPKIFPELVFFDVVEGIIQHKTPKSLTGVRLGWDLVTEKAMAYDLHNVHTHETIEMIN